MKTQAMAIADITARSSLNLPLNPQRRFCWAAFWMSLLAGLIVLATTCICGLTLYLRSLDALRSEVQGNLIRTATAAAALVDGDLHRRFVSPRQETSAAYLRAIEPLRHLLKSSDDIKFVYTCVLSKNQVYFVLDPTPPGKDASGVDQKSHVMQLYPESTPEMLTALRTGQPVADADPSSDPWGTFISGYAPILDSRNRLVGIVGVDLTAVRYVARMARMRRAATLGLGLALGLSMVVGLCVFFTQRAQIHASKALREAHNEMEARVAARTAELAEVNLLLQRAYDATIEGWSRAMDLRDHETEGHCQRVTDLTLRLARGLGISEEQLIHIRRGALLHDIGKMGVPDAILLKPGPLTDQEWVIMHQHPRLAYEMLSPIDFLRPALSIPYCHHEKWDGGGYPRQLRGEAIPLEARIFAIIDVWDALRSDRPYRAGWPELKIYDHLQQLAGTHFDPRIVTAFVELNSTKSLHAAQNCAATPKTGSLRLAA